MDKILILLMVGVVFYLLTRNYKSSDFQTIQLDKKQRFEGDLLEHEAGLLVAMLAKVAKADGVVSDLEAELLSNTFTDISSHFENNEQIREQLKTIYKNETKTFDNTIDIATKYYELSKSHYKQRVQVMEYLLNLAFIDGEFSKAEFMITEDIANAMQIKKTDFENLIATFEQYYAQKQNSQAVSLENAYKVLGATKDDDMATIKKKYRSLVKQNHPDIVAGRGASQSIIEEATKKLQQINEAYEVIKKQVK
jgi:DnaJ like chaperone protein